MAEGNNDSLRNSSKSRRRFLGYVAAGTLPLVAGCSAENGSGSSGGSSSGTGSTSGSATNTSMSSSQGGHLRVGVHESPQTLNPLQYATAEGYIAGRWIYSNLTQLTPSLKVQPDLATDWTSNSDATKWTFQLRDDATFHHNGESVTAEDVAATINAIYAEDSGSAGKGALGPIDSVEETGEYEVTFTLTRPFADLSKTLTSQWGRIVPKTVVEGDTKQLATKDFGSGPYTLEEFTVGDRMVVSRYDDYYKSDDSGNSLPYLSQVTMKIQPETITQINSLSNHETDILQRVPASQYKRVSNMQGGSVLEKPGGWFYPIVMRTTEAPFDDLRVRQAIKYAVNRKAMLNGARQNRGVLGQDTPISPVHQYYTDLDDKFSDTANIQKAKQLLSDAGYSDGLKLDFPLYVTPEHHPPLGPSSVLFQEQMKKAGIEFEIQQVSWDRFLSEIEAQAPFYVSAYGLRIVESQILNLLYKDGGTFYGTMWHETQPDAYNEFISAVDQASATTDKAKRKRLYTKAQRIVRDKGGIVVPFFSSFIGSQNNYVNDYQLDPTGFRIPLETTSLASDAPTK